MLQPRYNDFIKIHKVNLFKTSVFPSVVSVLCEACWCLLTNSPPWGPSVGTCPASRRKRLSAARRDVLWPLHRHHWCNPESWWMAEVHRRDPRSPASRLIGSSQRQSLKDAARVLNIHLAYKTLLSISHRGPRRKIVRRLSSLSLRIRVSLCMNILSCVFKEFCS